jgi:hypothetical protein
MEKTHNDCYKFNFVHIMSLFSTKTDEPSPQERSSKSRFGRENYSRSTADSSKLVQI